MPRNVIFPMGNLNAAGICHAICGQWVRLSRLRGNVTSVDELGQAAYLKLIWDDPNNNAGIDRNNLLGQPAGRSGQLTAAVAGGMVNTQVIANTMTANFGHYFIIVFWNAGHTEGHSVAARLHHGNIEFIDPNTEASDFTTPFEMANFAAQHIQANYPLLLSQIEIIWWT